MENKIYSYSIIKISSLISLLFLIALILMYAKSILAPIIISLLLAIAINPLSLKLEKGLGLKRGIASFISILIVFITLISILFIVALQLASLIQDIPDLVSDFINKLDDLKTFMQSQFNISPESQVDYIIDYIKKYSFKIIKFISIYIKSFVLTFTKLSITTLITIFYTFFFLVYKNRFLNFALLVASKEYNEIQIKDLIFNISKTISNYLLSKITVIFLLSIIQSILLYIFKIKFPFVWGTLGAIFSLVPYIGVAIGALLPIIIISLIDFSIYKIIGIIISFSISQFIESYIFTPYLVGSKVNLNPFATLIVLIIGNFIWGTTGLILSIPIFAILKVIFDNNKNLRPYGYLMGTEKYK